MLENCIRAYNHRDGRKGVDGNGKIDGKLVGSVSYGEKEMALHRFMSCKCNKAAAAGSEQKPDPTQQSFPTPASIKQQPA